MKLLFDTNVIVAALVQDHEAHAKAFPLLDEALNGAVSDTGQLMV
ncbi:MAG: hypothetical protein WD273_11205 [Trueperaceae bacterium]